jgi:predicted ATP-dependent endonuclease of OLD family
MLVGLFIRHYKSYKNINFVPITTGASFTAYLGANGAGKSSILDALDKFFNGGEWSINLQARSEGGISTEDKVPFIVPVFLLEKPQIAPSDLLDILNNYYWTTTHLKGREALTDFYKLREELSILGYSEESHYLIAIGKQSIKSSVFLGPFWSDADLTTILDSQSYTDKELGNLLTQLINLYAYFYIPVEADASIYSALESQHVLKLLDEDIRSKIESAISRSTVEKINGSLSEFIGEINDGLVGYEFKGSHKNKLTMNDLVEKVFEAYFSIKILHGKRETGSVSIRDMSAGEKRRALIDLAYSLLARSAERSHIVILALDEPDASLHTSACHDQFAKLAGIPQLTSPETQVLVTTHWYGFLPIVQHGVAHALNSKDGKIEFTTLDLYNYREQIKQKMKAEGSSLAIDVELKSHNDMIQSIVASVIRDDSYNWILCEGLSDKIYLEYFLQPLVDTARLRIIPLGGFKEVKRAYDYLVKPLNDKEYSPKGKILCIVDTDRQLPNVEIDRSCKHIDFKKIIYNSKIRDCELIDVNSEIRSPATEIEHALQPEVFLDVADHIEGDDGEAIRDIVHKEEYKTDEACVYGFLDLAPSQESRLMSEFFDINDNKVMFAKEYVLREMLDPLPTWVRQVSEYFTLTTKRTRR